MIGFRRATSADALAICRVSVESWRTAYQDILAESCLPSQIIDEVKVGRLRTSLAEMRQETYVAEECGLIVGHITIGPCLNSEDNQVNTGEIWGIYILPLQWRKGIGRLLLDQGQRVLELKGYGSAILWVLESNWPARLFYEAMGFGLDNCAKDMKSLRTTEGFPARQIRYRKQLSSDCLH